MGKLPNVIPYYNTIINDVLNLYATKFAKRDLIHAPNFSTLRMYNSGTYNFEIWWQNFPINVLMGLKISA